MKILKVKFENGMIAYGKKNDQEFAEYVFEIRENYKTRVSETEEIENNFLNIDNVDFDTF